MHHDSSREKYKNPLLKLLTIVLIRPMWLSDGVSYENDNALLDRETKAVMKERDQLVVGMRVGMLHSCAGCLAMVTSTIISSNQTF